MARRRSPRRSSGRQAALACLVGAVLLAPSATAFAQAPAPGASESNTDETIRNYFSALEAAGLIDAESGSRSSLRVELDDAEKLLRAGNPVEAAIALYGLVESPRYEAFGDFVEYQNAEYYLGVALAAAGANDSALIYLLRVMERGPSTLYFSPAHRRAVDIAISTRRFKEVLDRLTRLRLNEPIPTGASGERTYLRARIAYQANDWDKAEAELSLISRKSRLYSSALYMRGVIRTRRGDYRQAASALCEVAETPDNNKFTFVVDDRYFAIKDLARLGLGRLAHENAEYDDAYYHYFQIPEDSDRLPEALFEAAWSMYQKRELDTARDLSDEFLKNFSTSHLVPEAQLLRGYVDLADCEFDAAQKHYDQLVAGLGPVVKEIARIRKSPALRRAMFKRAMNLRRAERADPTSRVGFKAKNITDRVLSLLQVDPQFVRLHRSVSGLRRATGDAPHVVRAWSGLARKMSRRKVGAVSGDKSLEQEDADDANQLLEDVRRLQDDLSRARAELKRGERERLLPPEDAAEERKRLATLSSQINTLHDNASKAAEAADAQLTNTPVPKLSPMVRADLAHARQLRTAARALLGKLGAASDTLTKRALDKLYSDTKRVLDKARLGKIDAVIGQKRRLDIEVSDLASGRYPPELQGRLWEQGLIGDDEELWPIEDEYWADEYTGWR